MTIGDEAKKILFYALKVILESSPDMVFIKDKSLHYVGASQVFVNMVGLQRVEELVGKTDYDIFTPELAKRYTDADKIVLDSGHSLINSVEPIPEKNGKKSYSSTSKYVLRDDKGEIIGLYGNGRDVTAQVELEEERESRDISRQLFEDVLEADITKNLMLRAEGSVCIMSLGLSQEGTFEETVEALASRFIHPDYAGEFRELYSIEKLISDFKKGKKEFLHITYQSNNGINYRWMEFKSRLYFSSISNTLRITTCLKDLDDEIRTRQKLRKRAETDALTGLLNRESLMSLISKGMEGEGALQLHALLFIDLDFFKDVNDNLGHPYGDKVLQEIAEKLSVLFRDQGSVGRIGGDEFLVFIQNVGSKKEVEEKALEIVDKVAFYQLSADGEARVTCSVGVAMYPVDGKSVSQLYENADKAMYSAKKSGKNRAAFHEASNQGEEKVDMGLLNEKKEIEIQRNKIGIEHFTSDKTLYDALSRSTDDYIYLCDMATNLFYFPESMVEEFDLPGCVMEDATPIWGERIHENERGSFFEAFQEMIDGKTNIHCQEYRAINKDGNWVWLRCRGYLEHDAAGVPTLFAGIITNLGKKGKIDHVSGLPNKFEFESYIRSQLAQAQKGCMLLLGLDNFKHINTLYGKQFGDLVISNTAKMLQELIPPKWKVYRMDGDVFGVFFPDGKPDTVETFFYSLQRIFRKQQELEGNKYTCTISGGGTYFVGGDMEYSTLFKQAEYGLEYAKASGKNRINFYSEETMSGRERSLALMELLRQSVEHDFADFELYFQPQVNASTCDVVSAEALLRWKCKEYGSVSPVEFIPLLEQTGMIQPVGYWVLSQATHACKEWRVMHPDFTVSVNLSYLQLLDKQFTSRLVEHLKVHELEASALHLELTESRIVDANHTLKAIFDELRSLGFGIEMDDFGTGYSSLEILKYSPADVVKIDRAFVKDIVSSDFDATFIRFAVSLCHSVGITVCLEGVETIQEYQLVKEMELDLIQGFLFGRPVSKDDFEKSVFKKID